MRINEAAARSGLTQDTIRFYEKPGMLDAIRRDARGWRVFSSDDVNWLTTLERLRATGMPLDDVKRFAVSAMPTIAIRQNSALCGFRCLNGTP